MELSSQFQKITACVFLHKDGKLFAAKRALTKKFLPGKYELPGGHIEFGETMEEGLMREIKEEFHIGILVWDPIYVFTYTNSDNTKHTIEVIYYATPKDENQKIILNPEDHSEYSWLSKDEILTYFKPDDEECKAILKGFELLAK